jgi:hypothetical protein
MLLTCAPPSVRNVQAANHRDYRVITREDVTITTGNIAAPDNSRYGLGAAPILAKDRKRH